MPGLLLVVIGYCLRLICLLIQIQVKYLGHWSLQRLAASGAELIKMLLHGAQCFADRVDLDIIFLPLFGKHLDELLEITGASFQGKAGDGLTDERQDCV